MTRRRERREGSRMNSLDDLELELRKLPGVKAAGFDEREDMLLVQLHLGDRVDAPEHPVPIDASRIVARHIEERTAVEIVRWRNFPAAAAPAPPPVVDSRRPQPARGRRRARAVDAERRGHRNVRRAARLLAVLAFPDTDELEVHLILDGRRTIGRAVSSRRSARRGRSDTRGGAGARRAVRRRTPLWAREIENDADERVGRRGGARRRRRRGTDRLRHRRGSEPDRRSGAIDARRAQPSPRPGAVSNVRSFSHVQQSLGHGRRGLHRLAPRRRARRRGSRRRRARRSRDRLSRERQRARTPRDRLGRRRRRRTRRDAGLRASCSTRPRTRRCCARSSTR